MGYRNFIIWGNNSTIQNSAPRYHINPLGRNRLNDVKYQFNPCRIWLKKTDKIEKRTYGINRFFIALSARLIGFFDNIPEKKKNAGIMVQCISILNSIDILLMVNMGGVWASKTNIINKPFALSILWFLIFEGSIILITT